MRQADLQETFSLGDPNNQADPPEHNGVTEEEWDALAPREKLAIVARRIEVLSQQNDLLKAENEQLRTRLMLEPRVGNGHPEEMDDGLDLMAEELLKMMKEDPEEEDEERAEIPKLLGSTE